METLEEALETLRETRREWHRGCRCPNTIRAMPYDCGCNKLYGNAMAGAINKFLKWVEGEDFSVTIRMTMDTEITVKRKG